MEFIITACIVTSVVMCIVQWIHVRWAQAQYRILFWLLWHLLSIYRRVYGDACEFSTQLQEERRMRADLVKWIEIETGKYPHITRALKQRIDERLEVLRQLRQQRWHMRQR